MMRRCGLPLFLAVLGCCAALARADEPLGFLHVERDGVSVGIPDRGAVFKVGNTGRLFQLKDDVLVIFSPAGNALDGLYAVRWDRHDAPAWVSNERLVTFGKVVATVEGSVQLDKDEKLPVVAIGQRDFRVLIQRFGNTASLDIHRDTPGVRFEAANETPNVAATPKPVAKTPAHVTVAMPVIRTNDETAAATVQTNVVATQSVASVVLPPAMPRHAATNAAAAPPFVMPASGVRWPSLLEDRASLIVIGVFLVLLFVLLQAQKRLTARHAAAGNPPAVAAGSPSPGMKMKKGGRKEAKQPEEPEEPRKLKFASSKKNQTIILGQQNLVGSVPGMPMSASDTSIIPSPPVLPDRRSGGVLWIGKYQVEQLLGRGRMGVVYKAFQQDLNRSVALKLLAEGGHASDKHKERFVKEAQALAKLRHPNIVTVYEVGEWEGQPFFTMDFVDGKPLDKMIVKQRLPPRECARLVKEIAEAMEYAHVNGIIHRDLKPGNIILNNQGEPVIMDFGLARKLDETEHAGGDDILGTPAYMSPEQARGRSAETDARSDVYSVGAILYALLTGEDPFSGNSLLEILHKVIHDKPVPPEKMDPQIDAAISGICMKALGKEPKKRQQSAGELASDLGRYLQILASGKQPAAAPRTGIFARIFARG